VSNLSFESSVALGLGSATSLLISEESGTNGMSNLKFPLYDSLDLPFIKNLTFSISLIRVRELTIEKIVSCSASFPPGCLSTNSFDRSTVATLLLY
jgi:hypothetical protein